MDTHGNTQEDSPAGPRVCANGCGFFANEPSEMCSKCSRELQAAAERGNAASKTFAASTPASSGGPLTSALPQASPAVSGGASAAAAAAASSAVSSEPAPAAEAPQQPVALEQAAPSPSQVQPATAEEAPADDRPVQKNTSRCFTCKKKIGLTGFKCRCGYVFCGSHRLAEAHECDFDYKSAGRDHLAKANPIIQADKVARF